MSEPMKSRRTVTGRTVVRFAVTCLVVGVILFAGGIALTVVNSSNAGAVMVAVGAGLLTLAGLTALWLRRSTPIHVDSEAL